MASNSVGQVLCEKIILDANYIHRTTDSGLEFFVYDLAPEKKESMI